MPNNNPNPNSGRGKVPPVFLTALLGAAIAVMGLTSCACPPVARQQRLIRMPYEAGPLEGYSKENYGYTRPLKAIPSQAPLTQAGEYAPLIKSQQYAQVPRQIIQLPEIHNVDAYSPPTQEVKFDLVPVTAYPPKGYYPDPKRAYVPGGAQGTQQSGTPAQGQIQRRLVTIETDGETLTGYARTLGILSRSQRAEAEKLIITKDGEELIYINRIGWVGFIPQPSSP